MSGSSPRCGGNIFLRIMLCALCLTVAVVCVLVALPGSSGRAAEAKNGVFDRGDNALWMRRHWMHEGPTTGEIAALVESLRARGIKRIYPFLGPMDREGWPGWRSKAGFVRYDPKRTGAFGSHPKSA